MPTALRRGVIVSFDSATWTAYVMLDGALSEVEMPVGEWVPGAMLAADDDVAVLLFEDTNPEDGVILGPYGAVSEYSYPRLSGLTAGQPLRATGAAAAAFGALDLANASATTGALPHTRGGTGQTATPANGQLPIGNGAGYTLAALLGTANQVNVLNGAGSVTLSLPQSIHSGATPTFAGLSLGSGWSLAVYDQSLANGSTLSLGNLQGLVLVVNSTDNGVQLVSARAGGNGFASVHSNNLALNLNSDAGTTYALYWDAGAASHTLKNRYGSTKSTRVLVLDTAG